MAITNRAIAAGTQFAFFGVYDSNDTFTGSSSTLTQGALGNGMTQLLGIQRTNPGPVEPGAENVEGDDTSLGQIEFPPNELPQFDIEQGVFDLSIIATLQTTNTVTRGQVNTGVIQPNDPVYPDTAIIVQSKSKKKDAGVDGKKAWSGYIIPLTTIVPLYREEFAGRTAASNRYRATAQVADKEVWGITITDSTYGTDGAPLIPFIADSPITVHVFEGDGSTAAFGPLDFTPVGVDNMLVVEGNGQILTSTTDFTVDTAAKTVTRVAGNLAAGTRWYVMYEFVA